MSASHSQGTDTRTLTNLDFSATAGALVEFYDFFIYGYAAASAFPAIFSPSCLQFVPEDHDKDVIAQCGLRLLMSKDVTANMAAVAEKRRAARESRSTAVRQVESDRSFEAQQSVLAMTARLVEQRRLSRFAYLSENIR